MAELYLVAAATAHEARSLRLTAEPADGIEPLLSISEDGEVTAYTPDRPDRSFRLRRELRHPAGLLDLVEKDAGDRRWLAWRLLLAAWEEMRHRDELGREADRWTRTLLLVLQARASLRSFARAQAADTAPWDRRAARDLLDAAAALRFFDHGSVAPFLQWLVAVLPRDRAAAVLDDLLPAGETLFVERLFEGRHRELRRIVAAVSRAQRRQYFFGRYDLRGASRLRRLQGRLRFPESGVRAFAWSYWLWIADHSVPRMLAGCVVGILPFLLTDEAWRLVSALPFDGVALLSLASALAVLVYLHYDRIQADPAALSPRGGVGWVWLTGVAESLLLAAGVQWLAAPAFHSALGLGGCFNGGVFVASAAFALGVGVFTQLIWQDRAVTAPP